VDQLPLGELANLDHFGWVTRKVARCRCAMALLQYKESLRNELWDAINTEASKDHMLIAVGKDGSRIPRITCKIRLPIFI
jgi:hypothetical protein